MNKEPKWQTNEDGSISLDIRGSRIPCCGGTSSQCGCKTKSKSRNQFFDAMKQNTHEYL